VVYGSVGSNLHPVYTAVKRKVPDLPGPFASWRILVVNDVEVLQGRLHPAASAEDPAVRSLRAEWDVSYVQTGPFGLELTLSRRLRRWSAERWWLHLVLLLLTLATATVAGALLGAGSPSLRWVGDGAAAIPVPAGSALSALARGLWFSLPLCAVLGGHEIGHYLAARRHGMDVSPPYFIPAPWFVNPIGTFGAFIRLRSPLLNRVALLDVGAAGPLAGFALAVPVTLVGLSLSTPLAGAPLAGARIGVPLFGGHVPLGESAMLSLLRAISPVGDAAFVELHPLAFAGWVGLFFTALNLFPLGQLDGGHLTYALSSTAHRWVGAATVGVMLALAFQWIGWLVLVAVVLLLGRGRLAHPPVLDPALPLDRARRRVGWLCAAIFLSTLVPVPFPL
jgi:hypothetical protein